MQFISYAMIWTSSTRIHPNAHLYSLNFFLPSLLRLCCREFGVSFLTRSEKGQSTEYLHIFGIHIINCSTWSGWLTAGWWARTSLSDPAPAHAHVGIAEHQSKYHHLIWRAKQVWRSAKGELWLQCWHCSFSSFTCYLLALCCWYRVNAVSPQQSFFFPLYPWASFISFIGPLRKISVGNILLYDIAGVMEKTL